MSLRCEQCNKPATVHLTELKAGKKLEKHLCEQCASQLEGVPGVKSHTPINELLTNFVLAHSGGIAKQETLKCECCEMTWAEFRQGGSLGCEHDYTHFEKELVPLLERAHEGVTHHVGKVPSRRGGTNVPAKPRHDLAKLRKELAKAVEAEDYERAARIRDQIRKAEA
jgi:protein arginine kinase activator